MWLRQVAVCGGVYVVRRGVVSQCVVLRRVSCWYLVGPTGYVNCCVAVLCGVSLCACVVSRVSWCCFVSRCPPFSVLRSDWFGNGLFLVVLCGAVSCGVVACLVAFRCGALPCGLLRCVVLLLLILVRFDGFSFCGVVSWHVLWPFSLLCGFLMACCFVGTLVARHCCVVWCRVLCCCVLS